MNSVEGCLTLCSEEEDAIVVQGYDYEDNFVCSCLADTDPPSGCLAFNPAGDEPADYETRNFNVCTGASSSADLLGLHL